ncbi:MAG TPA: hypothetical protein PK156_17910 [Polyangium sp.]|nr:hypothetical protein [Polyangium sp.]
MLGSYRYVTSYLFIGCLAVGSVGCGSSNENCRPAVSANAVGNVAGDADADARARADAAARARANATADADAAARARVPPTDAELKEAAALRAKARANIDAGRLREALPDLERAFALSGDVTMLGDLGLSLDAAGRFDEAWVAMYRFRAEARAAYEPMRAKIDAKLGELEKKLGGLMIDTDTPGAEVIVRGQVVARLPLATPIYLAPGDASVIVRAPGKPDFAVRQRVAVGAVARASANLAALGAGVAGGVGGAVGGTLGGVGGTLGGVGAGLGRPTGNIQGPSGGVGGAVGGVAGGVGGVAGGIGGALPAAIPPTPPIWPIVVGVGGVVVVGGAIAASVVYKGHLDDFDAKLCGKSGASPECPAINSSLSLTKGLQVAGYLVGGLALTGGIIAFAVTRSVKAPEIDCPKVGRAAPLRVSCGVGADGQGGGVSCVGTF